MKELTGIGSEVEMEIRGNAIVMTPAQDTDRPETQERRARFAAARERIFSEYDELFRKLAE